MKIVAITASPRDRGACYNIVQEIKKNLSITVSNLDFLIYNLYDMNLEYCEGCLSCFSNHKCIVEDDINIIKDALISSDYIIFASPVYFQNVSAIMKNLIDRLSYWSHTMELVGKLGIIITTSQNNGNDETAAYIQKFFSYLGIMTIAKFNYESFTCNKKQFIQQLNRITNKMKLYYNYDYIKTSVELENIFQFYKNKFNNYQSYYFKSETEIWESVIKKFESFDDFFNHTRNSSKVGENIDKKQNCCVTS